MQAAPGLLPEHVQCLQGRCAAVALYLNQLALLPVMETEGLELDLLVEDPYSEAAGIFCLAVLATAAQHFRLLPCLFRKPQSCIAAGGSGCG